MDPLDAPTAAADLPDNPAPSTNLPPADFRPSAEDGGRAGTPTEAPVADVADAADDDADLDALAHAALTGGRTRAQLAEQADKPKTAAAAAAAAPAGTRPAGTTPAPAAVPQPAAALSPDETDLVRRFQVDPEDLPADPARRGRFLANLRHRHADQAQLYRDLQQARGGQPAPATPQAQAPQTPPAAAAATAPPGTTPAAKGTLADALARFKEQWGDHDGTLTAGLSDAFGLIQEQLGQVTAAQQREVEQAQHAFWEARGKADIDAGLSALKESGVNFDRRTTEGRANADKLQSKAAIFLAGANARGMRVEDYGWQQALADALPTVFPAHAGLAQRRAVADAAKRAGRGGADHGSPRRSDPRRDDDAALDDLARTAGTVPRDDLAAMYAGGR